jgi:hypothetical protein
MLYLHRNQLNRILQEYFQHPRFAMPQIKNIPPISSTPNHVDLAPHRKIHAPVCRKRRSGSAGMGATSNNPADNLVEIVFGKIEKCQQAGESSTFCLGFATFSELVHEVQDTVNG